MKPKTIALTLAAGAVAMLVAACGGGGGGDAPPAPAPAPDPSLQVSGTAATGAALADASVEVKCATGTGTATTGATGMYTVTITGGALPCLVEVKKTVGGTTITLHSVVEAGTLNETDRRTSAVANVTPITEMIVAHLGAALPEDSFKGFKGDAITQAQIDAAKAAIVTALKNAGIDVSGIDPLKAELVAGTSSGKGNAYDQLLDALGAKVDDDALKIVVNQIAAAALAKSDDGLKDAMEAVSGGSLAGCPVAVSGKYRTVDHFGRLVTRSVDFKTMKFQAATGTDMLDITADATRPCEFTASGTVGGQAAEYQVVMGPNGLGAYRSRNLNPATPGTVGYIFPAQSHSYSAFRGTWTFLQSGVVDPGSLTHLPGQVTFGEERKVSVCDYNTSTWQCVADTTANITATERADGGIDVGDASGTGVTLYAYRAPNGSFALFGTTDANGGTPTTDPASTLIAGKLSTLPLPAVGTEVKFWDVQLAITGTTRTTTAPSPDSNTVLTVDAATQTVTRKRSSDGREDVVHYNDPLAGVRTRDAGSFNNQPFAAVHQIPLPGMGLTLSVNSVPASATSTYIVNISVNRP
ncbi:hypothetical protein [Ramlibacter sp. AN1133]|uniref:hypothetical protein n=1 Tax=Ramlibacter sp. AN1133 TaxID=3133429 RepID=UPI0030BEA774